MLLAVLFGELGLDKQLRFVAVVDSFAENDVNQAALDAVVQVLGQRSEARA